MQLRRYALVLSLAISIGFGSCVQPGMMMVARAEEQTSAQWMDDVYKRLGELIHEYYGKAKITKIGDKIKVDYKSRPFVAVGNRTEIAPDFGGVMCDIELKPGPYNGKVRLPQQYHEYNFYSVILMAPYSSALNAHLYTKLLYPSDTPQEFQDKFKELMNEFDDNHGSQTEEPAQPPTPENSTSSQSPSSSSTFAKPAESNAAKEFFWKAQRGSDVVYLLGTLPFRQSTNSTIAMPSEIKDAFKVSKTVILDTIDLRSSLPYSDKAIRYESGDKLSKHLSPEARKALDSYLTWSGESLDMYDYWKPWFAAVAFESSLFRLNGFERVDWEKFIADKAKKDGKVLIEMESGEGKTKLYESLPQDVQDKLFTLSIKELMAYEPIQKDMENAWRGGDAAKLNQAANRELAANPDLKEAYDKLLEQRTNQVSKRIDDEAKDGPLFVAIDARNLVGNGGLKERLEEKGYSIEQICSGSVIPSAVASASATEDAPKASFGGSRLSRYTYPEGRFSIMLPGKPATRYTNKTGMRQVEYIYQDTQGAFCVGYIILPGEPVASAIPAAFDATAKGLTTSYNAIEAKEANATLQGFPGRIVNITKLKDKNDWGVHVRMFVAGRFLYILAAEGTTAWLKSPIVNQVSNSLTIATQPIRTSTSTPWTGTSGSDWPSQRQQSSPPTRSSKKWGDNPVTVPYSRSHNSKYWGGNN